MKKFTKNQIGVRLKTAGIIPVYYHSDVDLCKKIIEACCRGGIKAFEYTDRGEKAIEVFLALRAFVVERFPDILLGIGSILTEEQAKQFIGCGADFIVSPILNEKIVDICNKQDVYWIPGCATPTEIFRAENIGADIIKIFPGSVLGPEFVKAVRGPMPWLKLMPTGGVDLSEKNLRAWFDAGVVCVGIGSSLFSEKLLKTNDFDGITGSVKKALEIANQYIITK